MVKEKGGRNISLIPNGADIALFNDINIPEIRKNLGWEGKFIVLYAGAHGMSNDLGVVLDAAQLLKEKNKIHLVLLGDGKEKPSLIREVEKLDLLNVTFLDPVPKNRIAEFLSASDACIAILKPIEMYKTTYPNKVFDYMAARKPVILAIDGVIREVVEKAGCGIFCTPGDPKTLASGIMTLYNDQNEAVLMGNKGHDFLKENFSRERIAADLLAVMDKMVKKRG